MQVKISAYHIMIYQNALFLLQYDLGDQGVTS